MKEKARVRVSQAFFLEVALLPRYPILGESPEVNSSQKGISRGNTEAEAEASKCVAARDVQEVLGTEKCRMVVETPVWPVGLLM